MEKQQGFTLIEVLIAVVVLAGGLLGLAGLQARGLSNNQSAYNRSLATQLAYDIADRMRANHNQGPSYQTTTATMTSVNSCTAAPNTCTCSPSANPDCSHAELALADLFYWISNLQVALPSGAGTITCTDPPLCANMIYTITVSWDDNKDGSANVPFAMELHL
jgi:type IV pilus assembly protein PilV